MITAPDSIWPLVCITGLVAPFFLIAYFCLRIYCVAYTQIHGKSQLGLAWFFLIIELLQYTPTVLLYLNRILVPRRPRRPHLREESNKVPLVSVLITACGEEHDTILNTVRAACETEWPKEHLHVILCDDGRSKDLEAKMKALQNTYKYACYISREPPEIKDYKAGNLNYGVEFSKTLTHPPSEYVAGLDVDMIVQPHWLRALMPHFTSQKVGMDLDYFYAVTELVHEGLGAADCVGSGYVVRRRALEEIGGFPTFSISEDTACSSLLLGRRWQVVYVDEYLQCGEMPTTLGGHIKQRTRWTIGNIQTAFKIKFRLWGSAVARCSARQRLAGFVFGAGSLVNSTLNWLGFIGSPLALLAGYPFVTYHERWHLIWLLRLICLWIFSDTAHKASLALFVGYRDAMRWDQADIWLVPYYVLSFVRGFVLPKCLGGTTPGFVPSGSMVATITERRPHLSGFMARFRALILQQMIWIHVTYVIACIIGFSLNLVRCFNPAAHIGTTYSADLALSDGSPLVFLLTRTGWPPVWWVGQLISCWIPISYVLCPPVQVTADEALQTANRNCVRYPKEKYSRPIRTRFGRPSDHLTLAVLFYTAIAFAGSFYL